jgi:DNA-binding FadR family transcriptional regulator
MSSFQTSEFMRYLVQSAHSQADSQRLPSLSELSDLLGISVARLREQLEVARSLGFVEARPRTGIRRLSYSFLPAIISSLLYAIELDPANLETYSELRNRIEAAYYHQAVKLLTPEDLQNLKDLVARAQNKLNGVSIQIPHQEHRQLHMTLFSRLENPFVLGLLEAYWEAYEAAGLNQYNDYQYLKEVWLYHQRIVEAICDGDYESGYTALIEHNKLLNTRPGSTEPESPRTI